MKDVIQYGFSYYLMTTDGASYQVCFIDKVDKGAYSVYVHDLLSGTMICATECFGDTPTAGFAILMLRSCLHSREDSGPG